MSIAERVTAHLPYLRRFARSVTGSQKAATLMLFPLWRQCLQTRQFLHPTCHHGSRSIAPFLRLLIRFP